MKAVFCPISLCLYFITAISLTTSSNAAQILQNDPFEQPELIPLPLKLTAKNSLPLREIWLPQLRATIRTGKGSMANINGEIVKIGEKIDGFKLVKVRERDAYFTKNGMNYHVSMDQEIDDALR